MSAPFPGPRWCLAPTQMAAVDRAAIAAGLPGAALMESAGRSVAHAIRAQWSVPGRAIVLVGGGHNGGDGLVVARHLSGAGWRVELALFVDPTRFDGDAALQWDLVAPLELTVERIPDAAAARAAVRRARGATVVVDALLGTGLEGPVREPIRTALETLGEIGAPVVAVDTPSGLDGATGRILGVAAKADLTVTFGFPKPGQLMGEGPEIVGRLIVTPLGYPPASLAGAGASPLEWIALEDGVAALPARRHDVHKGQAGRLLVVAGSRAYPGAAILTATAALRSGAGMCVVATTAAVADGVLAALPEAIGERLPAGRSGALSGKAAPRVRELAGEADAIAIGPGLTTDAGVRPVVAEALASSSAAVVDADALNALAGDPAPVRREAPTLLTPHPGELGRWLGRQAADVDRDRVATAREAAGRWGAIVVLKGSPTVVAEPDGRAALNLTGNPGLAVGGSGDVLTGLIGSLLAQGIAPSLAARAGVFLHGLGADWARADLGERGLVPSDLFRYLPLTIREVAAGRGAALLERLDHRYRQLLLAGAGPA
jgi:hydroxyethylthiazole kinase-like uncharacterized protein yjeF